MPRRYCTIANDPVYQQRSIIVILPPLMLTLGTFKILSVARKIDHGYILKEDQGEEVLLPTALADRKLEDGENVRVFIFKDGEERITAPMQHPKITIKHIANLQVK